MTDNTTGQSKTDFEMRGESMTRIEAFVAAAFAFAVTMLVISLDEMPANFDELVTATKQIPAFAASCASIIWIWYTHAIWSRRYGLEDGTSIFLSGCLIFLVLIYIYPLRLMMQGLFFKRDQAGLRPPCRMRNQQTRSEIAKKRRARIVLAT